MEPPAKSLRSGDLAHRAPYQNEPQGRAPVAQMLVDGSFLRNQRLGPPDMLDSGHTKSVPRRSLSSPQPRTFHIGIDFGMTYSAVSGAITCPDDLRPPRWDDVFHINHWNAVDPLDTQVPSEMWYPANIPNPANESNDGDILWGYEVGEELYRGMTTRSREYIMRWLKEWFLDESTIPQEHLDELATKLALLYQTGITRKHIRTNTSQERDLRDAQESVSHYLTKILAHTRSRLKLVHKLKDSDIVKYVLTVPAIWSHRASRVLQSALEEAILASGLGRLSYGSIDDLFIANEPESAATWLVEIYGHSSFQLGETFLLVDAGGATVDVSTYSISSTYPLRISREVVKPGGGNCGSSHLNRNFERLITDRLRGEYYLFEKGLTIDDFIQPIMQDFETKRKRQLDTTSRACRFSIMVKDLRENPEKGFENNWMTISRKDILAVFQPVLDEIECLVKDQIQKAAQQNIQVSQVFTVGGFSESPSLRSTLHRTLQEISTTVRYEITLDAKDHRDCKSSISAGAVLRSMDLSEGPERNLHSQLGFVRREEHDPCTFPGHKAASSKRDPVDGRLFVNVIGWFATMPSKVNYLHSFPPIPAYVTFPTSKSTRLVWEEKLYVVDHQAESHYTRSHEMNKGAECAGKLLVDFTGLRDTGKLPLPVGPGRGGRGKKHYRIEFEIVPTIHGRNLRFEVKYPRGGAVQQTGQICIAATFEPGTG